ncbi:hypothetical protein P3X46_006231 [Hevea brasiliensis]|uniref:Protein transport protein SEC23 n=1 Tax=Hevea brasiliensis TaxID=3981 RepID=A0ABQ9MS70_HEVBR|nr:hypothetical protein P3X46_006231 [Hevea brasiliensis]
MDFVELEAIEGLRWSWNAWPTNEKEVASLTLSIMCTPLMLPILPYEPLICTRCGAVLNPYACKFPISYSGIGEANLPAELFPTYSTVEYKIDKIDAKFASSSHLGYSWANGLSSSNAFLSSMASLGTPRMAAGVGVGGKLMGIVPMFVFVVDACTAEEVLRAVKNELLLAIEQLPENALVALVAFDSMVRAYDLGFSECSWVVVFHGDRQVSSEKIQQFLGVHRSKLQQLGENPFVLNQGFLLPISECEFNITNAIEEICSLAVAMRGHRPQRCTGAAISVALGLLGGYLSNAVRTHRDLIDGHSPYRRKSFGFYSQLSQRLSDASVVFDLFACSLDQVGAAELKAPVERSDGQFRQCLRHIFGRDEEGNLKMHFDANIGVITTKDVKISGALGPLSDHETGEGGTYAWKLGTLANKICITFFFEVGDEQKAHPGSTFFIQFITHHRHGNMGIWKRVTTAARR